MSAILSIIAVGVDIAKAHFDAARLADGKYRHKKFDNTPAGFALFAEWLAGFGDEAPHVCLEATGAYSLPLAEYLAGRGFLVSVVNPAKVAAFGKSGLSRAKTDKADAKLIARFCLAMRPAPWTPPPAEIHDLQILPRRAVAENGADGAEPRGTADPAVAGSIRAVLATLEKEIENTQERIRRHVGGHPGLKSRSDLPDPSPASARPPPPGC